MDPLTLSISLMVLGVFIIVLELFVPSGGVLGVLAALCIVASIIVAFSDGNIYRGAIMLTVAALVLPVLIAGAIRLWPNTPIGRRVLIGTLTPE